MISFLKGIISIIIIGGVFVIEEEKNEIISLIQEERRKGPSYSTRKTALKVKEIIRMLEDDEISEYRWHREFVWDNELQIQYLSTVLNDPQALDIVKSILLIDDCSKLKIVDGKQRLYTLRKYGDLDNTDISEKLLECEIPINIMTCKNPEETEERAKEFYRLLNTK